MKIFAQWIKAISENQGTGDYYFRKNTILQFGNSWEVIGAAILINPGSALPNEDEVDSETKSLLHKISNTADSSAEWRAFDADSTMRFLEKIFSGWYIGKYSQLNGVILLYNLFNIQCQDLKKALELRNDSRFKESEMYTAPEEITALNVPIYLGWGSTGKSTSLSVIGKSLFKQVYDRVNYYTGDDFNKALFYHPLYINTSYSKAITQRLLRRFLKAEDETRPLLKVNQTIGCEINNLLAQQEQITVVEKTQSKLTLSLCDGKMSVGIVTQKSKQYIYWLHAKYDSKRTYKDFISDYEFTPEIRDILESYDYDVRNVPTLGEKRLNRFAAAEIEGFVDIISDELREIAAKISTLFCKTSNQK